MTIAEILKKFPHSDTPALLAGVFDIPSNDIYLKLDIVLTKLQQKKFSRMYKERIKNKPVAYILGYKYFYGRKFKVTQSTLIPRPETELLIEKILADSNTPNPKILDMGTGSGAIALTLKRELPMAHVTAVDISKRALNVAKKNSQLLQAKTTFTHSDLFSNITGTYDVIVANLPYVPLKDYKKLYRDLKYEPKKAITDNGDIIKRFLKDARAHLAKNGVIWLEIDPSLKHLFTETHKDLSGLIRFAKVK